MRPQGGGPWGYRATHISGGDRGVISVVLISNDNSAEAKRARAADRQLAPHCGSYCDQLGPRFWALVQYRARRFTVFERNARCSDADGSDQKTGTRTITLPDVPPQGSLLHVVLEYRNQLDLALANAMLLDVVLRVNPNRAQCPG